ncbi:MAG: endonuclease MutS2 [bacterium]
MIKIKTESLQILEFDKILKNISKFAHSSISEQRVMEITPLNNRPEIEKRFGQIEEIRRLAQKRNPLKLTHFDDITNFLQTIKIEGAILEPRELLAFVPVLEIISTISAQIKAPPALPHLIKLTAKLTGFPDVLKAILKAIDPEGHILDNASPELFNLRIRKRSLEAKINRRLEEIVRDKIITPFLQDNFITQRSGRWVIPIRMDSKGKVPGVVHDVSRSGDTAFTEPLEIIGITNELENIIAEEKSEEIRILRSICYSIRNVADQLESQYLIIVYLDVMNSIAKFADFLHMEIPIINNSSEINLVQAKHPLLLLRQKKTISPTPYPLPKSEGIVPLDLKLGNDQTVMVISGPNAGGKTVALKTIGILLVMALSGMPISVDSSSTLPLVNDILIDLGDEQSIEANLSTFSAHISNISQILRDATPNTLVLIDELGTGTDPVQGAALGCAILKELKEKGALALATTHLVEILTFVYRTNGMINASMEFDPETLNPLYQVRIGEPGQSHTLEIAQKYGLPEHVAISARELLGSVNIEWHNLLDELQQKRARYEEALREVDIQKKELAKQRQILQENSIKTKKDCQEVMEKAYNEASQVVQEVKREIYIILEEAKKEKGREARQKIIEVEQQIDNKLKEFEKESPLSIDEIKKGDAVFVRSVGYDATITRVDRKNNRVKVTSGNIDFEVSVSELSPKKGKTPQKIISPSKPKKQEVTPSKINLIGQRVDEATSNLERFLDQAVQDELKEVVIIHGVGTGALLKAVRNYVKGYPLVKGFRRGAQSEGGEGVTIVTF